MRDAISIALAVLLAGAALVSGASTARAQASASEIIAGDAVDPGAAPWVAEIMWMKKPPAHQCGGAILTRRWILTAAHCLDPENDGFQPGGSHRVERALYSVLAGSTLSGAAMAEQGKAPPVVKIWQIVPHPDYKGVYNSQSRAGARNDLALVKLASPLSFGANIRPISIGSPPTVGESLNVYGWGDFDRTEESSPDLLRGRVPVSTVLEHEFETAPGDVAGGLMVTPCHGDSGSPAGRIIGDGADTPALVGVVSGGLDSCHANGSTVYMNVDAYRDWIEQTIGISIIPLAGNGTTLGGRTDTAQTLTVNGQLVQIARGSGGLVVNRHEANSGWQVRQTSLFPDRDGWGKPMYGGTIRAVAVPRPPNDFGLPDARPDDLYVLARAADGLQLYRWDERASDWELLSRGGLGFTDASGFGAPNVWSTLQALAVGEDLYVTVRGPNGMRVARWDTANDRWIEVDGAPGLSDAAGWDARGYFSTIQSVAYKGALHVIARGYYGIQHQRFTGTAWETLASNAPAFSNPLNWGIPRHYETIQAVVAGDSLHLVARGAAGIWLHTWDEGSRRWLRDAAGDPALSDAAGWGRPEYYETIRAVGNAGHLYLVARYAAGLQVWRWQADSKSWIASSTSYQTLNWTDAAGWDRQPYRGSIEAVSSGGRVVVLARGYLEQVSGGFVTP